MTPIEQLKQRHEDLNRKNKTKVAAEYRKQINEVREGKKKYSEKIFVVHLRNPAILDKDEFTIMSQLINEHYEFQYKIRESEVAL